VASHLTRRPLPALIALVALLLFTGLVWWRVLHRSDGSSASCATHPASSSTAPAPQALPAPGDITVQLLNSTTRGGIAAKARTVLVGDGFNSPKEAANDRHKVRGVAEIRYGPAAEKAARLLAFYFPGAKLVPVPTNKTATVVVSLGTRYTKVAAPATVRAALARAHLATTTPSPTPTASASC
jgi:hypothetical protein